MDRPATRSAKAACAEGCRCCRTGWSLRSSGISSIRSRTSRHSMVHGNGGDRAFLELARVAGIDEERGLEDGLVELLGQDDAGLRSPRTSCIPDMAVRYGGVLCQGGALHAAPKRDGRSPKGCLRVIRGSPPFRFSGVQVSARASRSCRLRARPRPGGRVLFRMSAPFGGSPAALAADGHGCFCQQAVHRPGLSSSPAGYARRCDMRPRRSPRHRGRLSGGTDPDRRRGLRASASEPSEHQHLVGGERRLRQFVHGGPRAAPPSCRLRSAARIHAGAAHEHAPLGRQNPADHRSRL